MAVTEKIRDCSSFNNFLLYYFNIVTPSIQADQQIFSTRAKHLASKCSDRPLSLFDAHSPRQPSVSPASPAFSAPESYFTMHAPYLIICPRFTLGVAAVTEKNGGQTDGRKDTRTHTHTHTDGPTAITLRCACAQARVNNIGTPSKHVTKLCAKAAYS